MSGVEYYNMLDGGTDAVQLMNFFEEAAHSVNFETVCESGRKMLEEYLAEMGIELLYTPVYSPDPAELCFNQPRSQGLRGETVTKTLVKFVLSFQNFGEKIACAVRHNRIAITVEYGCVSLRMRFFSQNFGTIKRMLPGSSSPSYRENPGTEVVF